MEVSRRRLQRVLELDESFKAVMVGDADGVVAVKCARLGDSDEELLRMEGSVQQIPAALDRANKLRLGPAKSVVVSTEQWVRVNFGGSGWVACIWLSQGEGDDAPNVGLAMDAFEEMSDLAQGLVGTMNHVQRSHLSLPISTDL